MIKVLRERLVLGTVVLLVIAACGKEAASIPTLQPAATVTPLPPNVALATPPAAPIETSDKDLDPRSKWPIGNSTGPGHFQSPFGIAVDTLGNVYVADTNNNRIQKFDSSGAFLTKWGVPGSGDAQFFGPHGIAVDNSGNVYVVDTGNSRIQKFDPSGVFLAKWGVYGYFDEPNYDLTKGVRIPAESDGKFFEPHGIAVDGSGNVYVADTMNGRIQKFDSSGAFLTKWGVEGYSDDVGTRFPGGEVKYDSTGRAILDEWDGKFIEPMGVTVDGPGNVYVADGWNHRILKFSATGQFLVGWSIDWPSDIAVDSKGDFYVAKKQEHHIQKFDSTGLLLAEWGSTGSNDGQFDWPMGIAVDSSGDVYVADTRNHRVQKFETSVAIPTPTPVPIPTSTPLPTTPTPREELIRLQDGMDAMMAYHRSVTVEPQTEPTSDFSALPKGHH